MTFFKKIHILNNHGYSLFELVVVIVIIGILATVSLKTMSEIHEQAKIEETKRELDCLAFAIIGNPHLVSGGYRVDYGYIGDNGTLPSKLSDLVINPGLASWQGPYIKDKFYAASNAAESEYGFDAWGKNYIYTGGVTIISGGGSTTLTRNIAGSADDLLNNSLSFTIKDFDNSPPGQIYKDSLRIILTYPDGSGSMNSVAKYPLPNGFVWFSGLPIGKKSLRIIYLPLNDTLLREITVNPRENKFIEISLYENYW